MKKTKWTLLLLTGFFSALSVINLTISLSTDNWVLSEAKYDDDSISVKNSEVSYGLFAGKMRRYYLMSDTWHDLRISCNYGSNKCFYSCQQTSDKRDDEFERIMNDEDLATCPESTAKTRLNNEQVNASHETTTTTNMLAKTSPTIIMNQSKASAKYEKEFLSAGLWLTTVIFLALTIVFALLSGFFSMFNIWCNPASDLFGVFGLYVWNSISVGFCCLTMILWGSLYSIFISNNISITDTLKSVARYSSTDLSELGYSFWILFISIACPLINIGLIYYRNYMLQREPKPPAITVNKNDSTILVY